MQSIAIAKCLINGFYSCLDRAGASTFIDSVFIKAAIAIHVQGRVGFRSIGY